MSELRATDAFLTIGPRADSRIDTALSPPSGFIATAMDFRMTAAAERDGELIADLAAECRWLHIGDGGVCRTSAADKTGIFGDRFDMSAVANATRGRKRC